ADRGVPARVGRARMNGRGPGRRSASGTTTGAGDGGRNRRRAVRAATGGTGGDGRNGRRRAERRPARAGDGRAPCPGPWGVRRTGGRNRGRARPERRRGRGRYGLVQVRSAGSAVEEP